MNGVLTMTIYAPTRTALAAVNLAARRALAAERIRPPRVRLTVPTSPLALEVRVLRAVSR